MYAYIHRVAKTCRIRRNGIFRLRTLRHYNPAAFDIRNNWAYIISNYGTRRVVYNLRYPQQQVLQFPIVASLF